MFQFLKLLNFVINSWAGLIEISPITNINEIIVDKEALHLLSTQMDKYEIYRHFQASSNYDDSIYDLQRLSLKVKETVN